MSSPCDLCETQVKKRAEILISRERRKRRGWRGEGWSRFNEAGQYDIISDDFVKNENGECDGRSRQNKM